MCEGEWGTTHMHSIRTHVTHSNGCIYCMYVADMASVWLLNAGLLYRYMSSSWLVIVVTSQRSHWHDRQVEKIFLKRSLTCACGEGCVLRFCDTDRPCFPPVCPLKSSVSYQRWVRFIWLNTRYALAPFSHQRPPWPSVHCLSHLFLLISDKGWGNISLDI